MKFSINGALTIGTLDGANVEIREAVGADNFFLFGLTTEEVDTIIAHGYKPGRYYEENAELRSVIDLLSSGLFSHGDRLLFADLVNNLLYEDPYLVMADAADYFEKQQAVSETWRNEERWTRMSVVNVTRMGRFSSDRSVRDYSENVWRVEPVPVPEGGA
jgi:starch phosphorylase